jgi:translation initiation factor 2 alpha subunit (eIF-2alpha)
MNVIINLELVLKKVEFEINNNNTPATKTLMNTYQHLLSQFRMGFNFRDEDHLATLFSHERRMSDLLKTSHKQTSTYLNLSEYKNADNMVAISDRIQFSLKSIKQMLTEQRRFMNLPQNKKKISTGYFTSDGKPIYKNEE